MPAANVPMVIDQGEDYTTQLIWTDELGDPQPITSPMRLDIKNPETFNTVLSLETPVAPTTDIPEIAYSTDVGLIQIHIPRSVTAALAPGLYVYDFFVTVDDGNEYAGSQVVRILAGDVTVNKRITVMA